MYVILDKEWSWYALQTGASFPFCYITDSFSSINVAIRFPHILGQVLPTSVPFKVHGIDYIHFAWMNTLITFLCL